MSGLVEPSVRPEGAGERRAITVLFADIVGSTAIVERMDPEDWKMLVGRVFERMNETIQRYDGTIARLMGDGVLAFFGAPVAHEDDPERAVRCGLEMVRAVDEVGEVARREHGVEVRIRVGINTGPVVVGTVGTDAAHEYTAMGDAVNVAARMQTAARPGTVLVTATTHRFIAPLVESTDLGPLEVKGKSEAVHAFEITGLVAAARATRGLAGVRSVMVGRDAQLATLRRLFAIVQAGQGRMACVLGEPGIGKSRLLAELKVEVMRDTPATRWFEGRCLSYGPTLPHHLVLDLVRSMLGVGPSAGEPELRAALGQSTRDALGAGWQDAYTYLGHLLSLRLEPEERARLAGLEREVIKRYVASIAQLARAMSATDPLVLVLEDLHWADRASVDTLGQLVPFVTEMPVLCVATSRVDRASEGWRLIEAVRQVFGDALTEVRLDPLSDDQSRALVANLLAIESLPAATRDFILSRAEGNPLFVEEVIRMLIDRGAIQREDDRWVASPSAAAVEIPDTLQGLLLARIDRLPESSRRALRVASVIGRQFGVRILERLLGETS